MDDGDPWSRAADALAQNNVGRARPSIPSLIAACDYCKRRKRRCNGKLKKCEYYGATNAPRRARPATFFPYNPNTQRPNLEQREPSAPPSASSSAPASSTITSPLISKFLDPISVFLGNIQILDFEPPLTGCGEPSVPSYEDVLMVRNYHNSTQGFSFDVFTRITDYSALSAMPQVLRLTLCTYCGLFSTPKAPHPISARYYSLARKLIPWCIDHPTLESLQALILLSFCATSFGDHAARMSYKDMAFRLAALMKMDTPMLLQFPGEPDRVPTYQERTVRDLCWRTCLFLDNVFSWGTPHVKRFSQTRVMIPNLQFYRFLPPNDTSRTALVDYITTLSYVLLNIWQLDEKFSHQSLLAQDPKDNDVLTALGMLHAWRNGLPPNLNIDEPNFWRGATFSADNSSPSLDACGTRATLLLGYHGAMCLLGRVMIRQAASLGRFADVCRVHASASAVIIGRVSRDIVSHRHINLHPFMGQSVLMAGLFLCELWKDMNDAEKRREIDEVFVLLDEFLQRLSVFWLIAKLYMGILQKERATLRPNDERAIEFAINSGTRMTV